MQALILAAILNYPVTPLCQQWTDRMERDARYAARLVVSPQQQRHIKRSNDAAAKMQQHCAVAASQDDLVAASPPVASTPVKATGF